MIQVEGNINFYEELKKQLNNSKNEIITISNETTDVNTTTVNTTQDDEYIGTCLITNEKLKEGYVTMLCNHNFNYIPLFNDLLHHKKTLYLETQILKTNEIRCPYCRNKQSVLLPYYECMGVPKIPGINYFKRVGTFVGNCEYHQLKNNIISKEWYSSVKVKLFEDSDPNVICSNIVTVLKEDDKCYCSFHKIKAKSLYYKNKHYEKKLIIKKQKQAEKQHNQEIHVENLIIDMNLCNVILASGKNKGLQCSQKPYNNGKCKRHYNLQIKNDLLKITEEVEVPLEVPLEVPVVVPVVVPDNSNIQHDISNDKKYKNISSKFVQNYTKYINKM
jgi:DNA-directed RNA polymerase subunit RPC12/RpoP